MMNKTSQRKDGLRIQDFHIRYYMRAQAMQCSATEQRLSFKETIASTTHIKIIIIVFVFLVTVITSMILMKFGLKERSPIEYNIIEGTIIQFN